MAVGAKKSVEHNDEVVAAQMEASQPRADEALTPADSTGAMENMDELVGESGLEAVKVDFEDDYHFDQLTDFIVTLGANPQELILLAHEHPGDLTAKQRVILQAALLRSKKSFNTEGGLGTLSSSESEFKTQGQLTQGETGWAAKIAGAQDPVEMLEQWEEEFEG